MALRILITGALGHIGSYLLRDFPRTLPGADLILIDNLRTQRYPSLFFLPSDSRFRFVEADLTTFEIDGLVRSVDTVIHLAAITDATASLENREEVEFNNFTCTERLARACAASSTPLVALSTTSVYGPQDEVVDEDSEQLAPQSPYAEVKLREEELLRQLHHDYGLPMLILRFGTIFGPAVGMRFHTAVNKFCWQAVMGEPLTVWSTAYDQKRAYLDLRDAGRILAFAIEGRIFTGVTVNAVTINATVRQIVEAIEKHVPDLTIQFTESTVMNQLSYEVSRERSERLGFSYSGNLDSAIEETVAMLRAANDPTLVERDA